LIIIKYLLIKMKRFNLLSLVLLISIVTSLLSTTLISSIEDFSHGWNVGRFKIEQAQSKSMFFFGIRLKEKTSISQIAKEKIENGENTIVLPQEATIITLNKEKFSKQNNIIFNINGIFSAIVIGLCIYILVLTFKVVVQFRKEKVFEELNVRRCNKIGIFCVIIGLLDTFLNFSNTIMATKIAELKFYNISYSHTIEWTTIIIGMIILVFTEILKISTNIKQEQDLTI